MSSSAPLGSPVSAEYDPMRTAAKWSVHEGAGGSNGCAGDLPALRQAGSDPRPAVIGSLWLGYIAAGLEPTSEAADLLGMKAFVR